MIELFHLSPYFENLIKTVEYDDVSAEPKKTKYFELDLSAKDDETLVILNMILSKEHKIRFNTSFLGKSIITLKYYNDCISMLYILFPFCNWRWGGATDLYYTIPYFGKNFNRL